MNHSGNLKLILTTFVILAALVIFVVWPLFPNLGRATIDVKATLTTTLSSDKFDGITIRKQGIDIGWVEHSRRDGDVVVMTLRIYGDIPLLDAEIAFVNDLAQEIDIVWVEASRRDRTTRIRDGDKILAVLRN